MNQNLQSLEGKDFGRHSDPASAYTIEELAGPDAFHRLRGEWEKLWRSSEDATETQTWQWQFLFWKHLAPRSRPVVIAARDGEGRCAAIAAFYICRDPLSWVRKAAFLGDKRPDYHLILARPGLPESVGREMLDRIFTRFQKRVRFIELANVPSESYTGALIRKLCPEPRDSHPTMTWSERKTYSVPLPKTLEDYLGQLGPRSRRDFNYDRRRAGKEFTVEFRAYGGRDDLDRGLDDIETIDRARWGTASRYCLSSQRNFQRSLAHALSELGLYRAFVLYLDKRPAAFATGAIVQNGLKLSSIGHDPGIGGKLSIGKIANFYAIESCIQQGLKEYDLTRGGEAYKKWLGGAPRTNLHLRVYRSRWDRLVELRAKETLSFLKDLSWLRKFYRSILRR